MGEAVRKILWLQKSRGVRLPQNAVETGKGWEARINSIWINKARRGRRLGDCLRCEQEEGLLCGEHLARDFQKIQDPRPGSKKKPQVQIQRPKGADF